MESSAGDSDTSETAGRRRHIERRPGDGDTGCRDVGPRPTESNYVKRREGERERGAQVKVKEVRNI